MNPIDRYVAELAAELRGPARTKERLLDEIRDGLDDCVAAHLDAGKPRSEAVAEALREFGTPAELAPGCQRELTVAQTRRTAFWLLLTMPALLGGWRLAWTLGHDGYVTPPETVQLLIGIGISTVLMGVAALLLTQRLSVPDRLPAVLGWSATVAGLAMPTTTIALVTELPGPWPLLLIIAGCTVIAHGALMLSARTCRQCASLLS
ncbi:hypothetical protein GCM10009854_05910 [Saccharopolyspora halophila]|uniref:DUF1700 domain-containing protein n=1 Tax=Saccharopolyspora halophila TaxID=405551 RepID=A0ABN3FMY2_9PSEU